MRTLRAWTRALALLGVTLGHFAAFQLAWLRYGPGSQGLFDARWRVYRSWARRVAGVIGLTVKIIGTPPKPPYFFVMNHISYVDPVLTALTLEGATFVAKADTEQWAVLGPMLRKLGAIFVDRGSITAAADVAEKIGVALKAGYGVGMAPEATTSRGETVIPFHPPLLDPACRLGQPVSYATLRYRTPAGEMPAWEVVNWWQHDLTFQAHLMRLLRVPRFEATIKFCDAPIYDPNRKVLARLLHDAVLANFTPMVTADNVPQDHLE